MDQTWVGIDAGKEFHRAHVMDACGVELLSRKVENDEADLLRLIEEVLSLAGRSRLNRAIDQPGGGAALLLALLWERDQRVLYIPGLTIDRARDAYRGESKTDAKDAYVIADQSRMRSDLSELAPSEGELAQMQLLLARRRDLVADQSRAITRLRETLLSLFPALKRALDLNNKGDLTLVVSYQTPAAIRRMGRKRLAAYLKKRGVKGAARLAQKALAAAESQSVSLPAEEVAASIVAELAREILELKGRLRTLDEEARKRFFARPEAPILVSLPGMGPILGAEFLVATGDSGPLRAPIDSPPTPGSYRLPMTPANVPATTVGCVGGIRSSSGSLAVGLCYLRSAPASRAFYDRKRAEGKRHTQALIALARRRVNVLWAMLRDGTTFKSPPFRA